MSNGAVHRESAAFPKVTLPVAALVLLAVGLAWYVVWATEDVTMSFISSPTMDFRAPYLAAFFALIVGMMVAMMLPSALPMILAYRGLTRLEGGKPVRPADDLGTALFVFPYFLVWGAFGVLALAGLLALGLLGPLTGVLAFAPAAIVLAAGAYQLTRPKQACLAHCESPMGFVMRHWRSGRAGAVRMGLRHSVYCVGCCWLFMLVLFVTGAMSLLWMGMISILIFVEKIGIRRIPVSKAIGAILLLFGGLLAAQTIFAA